MSTDAEFSVEVAEPPGAFVVSPRGEIDLATVDQVRAACRAGPATLVLDLRRVEFLDSSGLRLVMELQRRAEDDGSRFVVVRGPGPVGRLFDMAGLNHRLRFVDDPAEAGAGG